MKKNETITVDKLLEKIPNKYELAIACGKLARNEYLEGREKFEVMDKVFKSIINDEIKIVE